MKNPLQAGKYGDVIALGAGAILPIAFAPFNIYLLAVIAPAIFLSCLLFVTPKQAFWRGFLFGFGEFGIGVSWVFISIHEFGNTSAPLAAFFTAGFVGLLALMPAIQAYGLTKLFPKNNLLKLTLAFPLTWVLLEWFRSWFLTGFPWLLLAYSQISSPLKGYIPIIGAYGVAFLALVTSGTIIYSLCNIKSTMKWIATFIVILLIWGGGFYLSTIQWTKPMGKPLTVTMVQGNIPQNLKWLPEHIIPTLKIYYDFTRQHWQSNIIIWPEAAIPISYKNAKEFLDKLSARAKEHNVSLITGIPIAAANSFNYYNAVIAIGEGSGHYYKRHLVPFGEYVPFAPLLKGLIGFLNIPMSDMVSGPEKQPDLKVANIKVAPFVCYEIAYARDLFKELPQAKILVTLSNDAWFGDSFAPYQHLEIGQFRAIQGGRELLFSGNSGLTAIVNDKGEIKASVPMFTRTVLTGEVQPMTGSTPWVRYGNLPIILIAWGLLLLIWLVAWIRRNAHT